MSEESDRKDRVKNAIGKYLTKNEPRVQRRNEHPEKEVVKAILEYGKTKGWDIEVIDAKAVFNEKEGRYLTGQVAPGYPDVSGNNGLGHALYIEAKAPGKRSTVRDDQVTFLLRKIGTNSFAVVVDSTELLEELYNGWLLAENKKAFLLRAMPRVTLREQKNEELNFEDP